MSYKKTHNGFALVVCMIFLAIFSALAVATLSMAQSNAQMADNQRMAEESLVAAQSGLECGRYIVAQTLPSLPKTSSNTVSAAEATTVWNSLCAQLQSIKLGNKTVSNASRFSDAGGAGDQIFTLSLALDSTPGKSFSVRFYRYDSNSFNINVQGVGTVRGLSRKAAMSMSVRKSNQVMQYAVASRCRMWITGNSTILGDIYSSWGDDANYSPPRTLSPFNMTSDSTVTGTINTIVKKTATSPYQLYSIDKNGNRVYMPYQLESMNPGDNPANNQIQGPCQGINYGADSYGNALADSKNIPGMSAGDYDTAQYKTGLASLATTSTKTTEYFPHEAGNYTRASSSSSIKLTRYVYSGKAYSNILVPSNRNALFKNCTFSGILYVDCGTSGTGNYNNIRFENCVFNGPIVTNLNKTYSSSDQSTWWQKNCLYFTGTESFQNNTNVPSTILAPNFNVNLGNTDPTQRDNNILTGAIVGGIVDVRGTATIKGTIISMYNTNMYDSGYVSNIGATLGDGGSETTEPGDVGVISIAPKKDQMLPSGITTPITIAPQQNTYSEPL